MKASKSENVAVVGGGSYLKVSKELKANLLFAGLMAGVDVSGVAFGFRAGVRVGSFLRPSAKRLTVRQLQQMKNNIQKIEDVKRGELVCKVGGRKNFIVGGYCRFNKRYELTPYDGGNEQYLKRGTLVDTFGSDYKDREEERKQIVREERGSGLEYRGKVLFGQRVVIGERAGVPVKKFIVESHEEGVKFAKQLNRAQARAVLVALFIGARVVVGCDESGLFTVNAGK